MHKDILTNKDIAKEYFVTVKGISQRDIVVPHDIADNTIEDNCDLLCRSLGIDLGGVVNPPTLHFLKKSDRTESGTLPFPPWDRSRPQSDSNVAFLLKAIYMAEGQRLSAGGMRDRLKNLVSTPYGLGALALIDKSPSASKALSYALSKQSNKLRFAQGNDKSGRRPILPNSPVKFRADYTSQRDSHIRTSVDMSDTTSIVDAFSRVVYAASFDAALQASINKISDTPIRELERQLFTSRETLAGYYNRAIDESIGRAYQSVLLSSNELIDRGAFLEGSRDPRMSRLKKDIQSFREGNLRVLNRELATRAICWNTNSESIDLDDIHQNHLLNHYYKDGVSAVQHIGEREEIHDFAELAKNMHSRRVNMADRSETYAYRKQRSGRNQPSPKPLPEPKRKPD
ncbi:hypothetical protein [Reinekea sp. G2M2-21]|uniref:hypothetical protein n=1 Tax=Reinekea sp. G2M2-21 TaxID=2788942 RepID=UPI0018A9BA73|nr:hypothetical protein [Reinekea sp. G2M2-21]